MEGWLKGLPWANWLLFGTVLWVAAGVGGTALSAVRGERSRVRSGVRALAVVVCGYMAVLVAVSVMQKGRTVPRGEALCFEAVCFSVERVEELPGFQARGQDRARLVRVNVVQRNTRMHQSAVEPGLEAYLLDAGGHRWKLVPGLGGVSLSTRLEPGGTVTSDPVFRVGKEANGLVLVITHRSWTWHRLVIGGGESLLHRPTEMLLE